MTAIDIPARIVELDAMIEEKEADLARKVNRRKEIGAKQTSNIAAKQQFCARLKTEIHQLTEEINNLKTELWGLREIQISDTADVW